MATVMTPEENAMIYKQVLDLERLEEESGRATWRDYSKQITSDMATVVRKTLSLDNVNEKIDEMYRKVAGDKDGLEFGTDKFRKFMEMVFELFQVPAPKGGEMVYAHMFRRFGSNSQSDLSAPQKKLLSQEECRRMVLTLAHIILKTHNLQVLQIALSKFAAEILASPAFKAELENLQKHNITGPDGVLKNKDKLLGEGWEGIFAAADVGRSKRLSWTTKQFHVFTREALKFMQFPEPTQEEVMRLMFGAFAGDGSDIITEDECKTMVSAVADAIAAGMR